VREGFDQVGLAGAGRAGDGQVLRPPEPLQGGQGVLGGGRDGAVVLAPGREGLPGRESGGAAALGAGGRDNGAPKLLPHIHPNYYAAFVRDPDGHNIEFVCHREGA